MRGFLGRLPVLRGRNEVAKNVPALGYHGEDLSADLEHYLGYVHRGAASPQDAWDMYKRHLDKTSTGLSVYASSGANRIGEMPPPRVGLPDVPPPPPDTRPELLGWEPRVVDGTTPLLVAKHGVGPTGQQSIGA